MGKVNKILITITVGSILYFILGSRCLPKKSIAVKGHLFGQSLNSTVDSELAELMLINPKHSKVTNLFQTYKDYELNTTTLSEISLTNSIDVATLYFLQKSYQSEINKKAQDQYLKFFNCQLDNDEIDISTLKDHYIVFVPGLAYKEDATTGADFARQRNLLTAKGISHELIETGEWNLTEDNAQLISKRLREITESHNKIIVVSASKGGLETAIVLGKILTPDETKSIKSWISVGGILRGSPIADNYLKAPNCWFAEFMLWTKGKKIDIVKDMSYNKRIEDFRELEFSAHIKIIHFVGAPLATQIAEEIKGRYCSMKKLGPNDGLTPIADEITKQGITISEIGLDHYYRDENIDKKTLALALVASQ